MNAVPEVADSKPIDHLGILAAFATAKARSDHMGSSLKSWVQTPCPIGECAIVGACRYISKLATACEGLVSEASRPASAQHAFV
jgi:hypothetical protein